MENNIRLSIILPFYGVEQYIGKCLETIYQQDIPEDEYEVICINDCSLDRCEEIVLQYAKNHQNLTLIRHDVNKKLGAARNTGLRAAKGRYVWFIDTDDYIEKNCLSKILFLCETYNLEMLHFGIQNNLGNIYRHLIPTDVISGPQEELISIKQQCIEVTFPWNRVYSRKFLLDNNLFFNDLYGGDVIHTILAVNICKRIKNVNEFFHYYRVDNLMSDTKSPATAWKIFNMSYVLAQAIDEIVPQIDMSWRFAIEECAPWRINTSIKGVLRLSAKEQRSLISMIRNNKSIEILINEKGNRKTKMILNNYLIMRIISIIYKSLRNIKSILKR